MARGGNRWGAGRPSHKLKDIHTRAIDVRRWQRDGLLRGGSFRWQWSDADTGEVRSTISVQSEVGRVVLIYTANTQSFHDPVNLTHTPCHYGGQRVWFECPRCHDRCARLYLRWSRFRCRACNKIAYRSQCEDALGRMWISQEKIEAKLGPNLKRPKFMHHSTYESLKERIWQLEEVRDSALCDFVARMGLFSKL
jgi:hypothetical protein